MAFEAFSLALGTYGLATRILPCIELLWSFVVDVGDAAEEISRLASELKEFSNILHQVKICLVERPNNYQGLERTGFNRTPRRLQQCDAWERLHLQINKNTTTLSAPPPKDRAWYKWSKGPDGDLETTHGDRERQRLILVTRLSDAPLLVEALSKEMNPGRVRLSGDIAAMIILDNFDRGEHTACTATSNTGLMRTLHAMEKILSSSLSLQERTTLFKTSFIKAQKPAEKPPASLSVNKKHPTRYLLRNTTIYECLIEEMFDCSLWSIWRVAEGLIQQTIDAVRNMSRLSLNSNSAKGSSELTEIIKGRSDDDIYTILEACQWVAFSVRPLRLSELSEAMNHDSHFSKGPNSWENEYEHLSRPKDVLSLCKGLLMTDPNGTICFREEYMKCVFLYSEHAFLQQIPGGHEMIAAACLLYLQAIHPAAIFRPWAGFEGQFRGVILTNTLWDYATTNWHEHYKLAEADSDRLIALLHSIVASAFPVTAETQIFGHGFYSRRNDFGLELCVMYGFGTLGSSYMSRGANANSVGSITREPLLFIAVAMSPEMVKLLLRGGADVHEGDQDGVTALHLAAALRNFSVAADLFGHSTGSNTNSTCNRCNELIIQLVYVVVSCKNLDSVQDISEGDARPKLHDISMEGLSQRVRVSPTPTEADIHSSCPWLSSLSQESSPSAFREDVCRFAQLLVEVARHAMQRTEDPDSSHRPSRTDLLAQWKDSASDWIWVDETDLA